MRQWVLLTVWNFANWPSQIMEDHQKGERRREYFQSQRGKEKNLPLKGKLWQLFELNILKTVPNFFPLPSPHPATQRAKFYSRPPNTQFTSYFVVVVQSLSHVQHFATPWTPQQAKLPCPSPSPRVCSNPCPLSQWYPIISSSAVPSLPAFNLSQHQGLFQSVSSLHQVAKELEFQHQSLQWIFRVDFL